MIKTTTTRNGQFRATVKGPAGVRYETPAYLTERMAVADAKCWAAFNPAETELETYMRMLGDVNAAHENVPVEAIRPGDYVLHTGYSSGGTTRRGDVIPARTTHTWALVTENFQAVTATDTRPARYRIRLQGVSYSEAGKAGDTMKVLTNPEALEAASEASRRATMARFRQYR